MTTSMRQARVDHIRQNMGGLPKTKDKKFCENFQALMNVFLVACGGDAGYAQLLMSALGDKVFGDQLADRIDYDLVENLKATLKDTNVDFGHDGVTATKFLCAVVIPDTTPITNALTIPRTNQFFQWKPVSKGKLMRKRFACFCARCIHNAPGACRNAPFCGNWKHVQVKEDENRRETTICGVKHLCNCACVGL